MTEPATEPRATRSAAVRESDSLRDKMATAIVGFILTGVIGTVLTTWVQQRGWAWQNRVAKIEKDTENAMSTYRAASEIINARWHATYRIVRAIERNAQGEEWKVAKDAFEQADRDWALRYTNISREVEFHIDTPFGIQPTQMLERVWSLPCTDFAIKSAAGDAQRERDVVQVEASAARVVLAVINHCHIRMKDEIEDLIDKRDEATPAEKKALAELSFRRLDHLYRSNETLRCVMFERAIAIRRAASTESYWGTFFGIGTPRYFVTETEKICVG